MDLLTGLVMQVCDCTRCYENNPCDRVLAVTEKIRKMKIRPTKRAANWLTGTHFKVVVRKRQTANANR